MTETQIYERYNEAVADIAIYNSAIIRGDANPNDKSLRDAGEGLSQTIEGAMKFHIEKHLTQKNRYNALYDFQLPKAVEDYYWCE